jgi:hypothetical protein
VIKIGLFLEILNISHFSVLRQIMDFKPFSDLLIFQIYRSFRYPLFNFPHKTLINLKVMITFYLFRQCTALNWITGKYNKFQMYAKFMIILRFLINCIHKSYKYFVAHCTLFVFWTFAWAGKTTPFWQSL